MPDGTRPTILAIDGPSGCGKSTIVPIVAQMLVAQNIPATIASNTEDSPLSGFVRELAAANDKPQTLALALAAARAYLTETRSGVVVCDRYVLSTFVYQKFSGVSADYLYAINRPYLENTVLVALQLTAAALTERRAKRPRRVDDHYKRRLTTAEEVSFFEGAITELIGRGHPVIVVPAIGSPEEVAARVIDCCGLVPKLDIP